MYIEVDGTGVPMVADELAGRKGKQPDGTAQTREVKLGSIFTQTRCDEAGRPERDYASTTYAGSFEPADAFGLRIRDEARRRELGRSRKVIFIVFRNHGLWPWVSGYAPAQLLTNCLSPYGGLPKAPCFARGCLLCPTCKEGSPRG